MKNMRKHEERRGKMRKNEENDEKDDGMCEKCCDAGRGNIQVHVDTYKELHRDVRYHRMY